MTENNQKQIVEINGVKMEVDLRHAQVIHENLKVGSPVKVLYKDYSEKKVACGVIVGFDNFKDLPTINVMYLTSDYTPEIKFVAINSETKDTSIVPDVDGTTVFSRKENVFKHLESEISKAELKLAEAQAKLEYFTKFFGMFAEQTN